MKIAPKKIWLILFLALLIRLINLDQSLWLDEAIQAYASQLSIKDLVFNFLPGDFNPPFFYLITWLFTRLLGNSETVLRLPSVLASIGTVYLTLKFLKTIKVRPELIKMGGILMATAPLLIYYSQEARAYSLVVFLVFSSMYCLWHFINNNISTKIKFLYFVSTSLIFLTHYSAWMIYPIQILLFMVLSQNPKSKNLFIILSPLLSVLPILGLIYHQLQLGSNVSASLPVWSNLSQFSIKELLLIPTKILIGRLPVENTAIFRLALGIPLAIWGIVIIKNLKTGSTSLKQLIKQNEILIFFISWLILPVLLGSIVALKYTVFSYFRFLYIAPAFYILLILSVRNLTKKWRLVIVALFLFINLISSGLYLFNPQYHREDWRGLAKYISNQNGDEKIVIIKPISAPLWYYNIDHNQLVDYTQISQIEFEPSVWLVKYSQPIFDPSNQTEKTLLTKYGFIEVEEKYFRGDIRVKYLVNISNLSASL